MEKLRRGLLAGLGAGLIFAILQFVNDNTPGRTLPAVTRWFGLKITDPTTSRMLGFLLLIILGALLGTLFGAMLRTARSGLDRSLAQGLLFGLAYWLIFPVLLGNIRQGGPFGFNEFLASFPLSLLFGLLLGMLYHQLASQQGNLTA